MGAISILVVDNEMSAREVCADVLEQLNYDVDTADSGEKALKRMAQKDYHIVLSDIRMGGMDGIELLKHIREKYPEVQVIMMTAYGTVGSAVSSIKYGAYDYLTKPLDMQKLQVIVERCTQAWQLGLAKRFLEHEVKEKTEKVMQLQQELTEADKLAVLGKTATGIAHQLRNPLYAIMATLEYCIEKYNIGKELKYHLETALKNVQIADSVINDLMEFSRHSKCDFKCVYLKQLIEEIMELVKSRCETQKIKVVVNYQENLKPIRADKIKIKHAILNLLANAIEAMPEGGTLRIVATSNEDNYVKLSIADTGVGIAPEMRSKIFEPFWTGKPGGIGLGLSISRQIICDEHGGDINIESKSGTGTTVDIKLPVWKVQNAEYTHSR